MYDNFLQCANCGQVSLTSSVINHSCPECSKKEMHRSFLYLDEQNQLMASLKDLPYPSPVSMDDLLGKEGKLYGEA